MNEQLIFSTSTEQLRALVLALDQVMRSPWDFWAVRAAVRDCATSGVSPFDYVPRLQRATRTAMRPEKFSLAVNEGQAMATPPARGAGSEPGPSVPREVAGSTDGDAAEPDAGAESMPSLSPSVPDSCSPLGTGAPHRGGRRPVTQDELAERLLATATRHPYLNTPSALVDHTTGTAAQLYEAVNVLLADGRLAFGPDGAEVRDG